ncbi:MAG: cytochrome-c peroxidase [Chitinophagaceae bacterium]
MKKLLSLFFIVVLAIALPRGFVGCHKILSPRGLQEVAQEIPESFPSPLYQFRDNPLTQEGIELGRRLFYEPRLSVDGNHPCASCHEQKAAFGTFEHDRSHGVFESHTLRNAPVLFNLAWSPFFHWDGAFSSFENEAVHPITGQLEMGDNFRSVIHKLERDPYYRRAFREVFKSPTIEERQILKALAQFTGTMVSANSKYDRYKKGEVTFNAQEQRGYQLFLNHCNSCHKEPLFTDNSFRNIGLPLDPALNDYGRMLVSGLKEDSLKFKVPTLRNVALTSNYMHDGRFMTVQQVLYHYRFGVQRSNTLDPSLQNGIALTEPQTNDLLEFLKTLSDSSFIQNPKLTRP